MPRGIGQSVNDGPSAGGALRPKSPITIDLHQSRDASQSQSDTDQTGYAGASVRPMTPHFVSWHHFSKVSALRALPCGQVPRRDRDTKFTTSFDEALRTEGIRIIRTPVRAHRANAIAIAERLVGTARRECLDRILIFGRRHLEQVLAEYLAHYNENRPHRGLDQQAPGTLELVPDPIDEPDLMQLRRNEILGGRTHEYRLVA